MSDDYTPEERMEQMRKLALRAMKKRAGSHKSLLKKTVVRLQANLDEPWDTTYKALQRGLNEEEIVQVDLFIKWITWTEIKKPYAVVQDYLAHVASEIAQNV